jgi:hypothetical protein
VSWFEHPLCAPRDTMPERFWGPERLDPGAWRELAAALEPAAEIAALREALADATDVVDVGGGTGLIAQAIAARVPVTPHGAYHIIAMSSACRSDACATTARRRALDTGADDARPRSIRTASSRDSQGSKSRSR